MDVIELKVRAAARAAQDVVVLGSLLRSTDNVLHCDAGDSDAVGRNAGWPAVEVIFLDVDAIVGDVVDDDVFVGDAAWSG